MVQACSGSSSMTSQHRGALNGRRHGAPAITKTPRVAPTKKAAVQNLSEQNGTHRDEALSEEEEGKQERQFQGPEITFNHLWFLDAAAGKAAL